MMIRLTFLLVSSLFCLRALAVDPDKYISTKATSGSFALAADGYIPPLLVSTEDYAGVQRVAVHLQNDLRKVTGIQPNLVKTNSLTTLKTAVIIGTFGKSPLIEELVRNGKLEASQLEGKWEKFVIQTVKNPAPGIDEALVIAGSDKRGTIFGIYDLSYQIGVHPWHFWADIPPKKHNQLYVRAGLHSKGEPKVKYRGIFINDEAPALSGWAYRTYGGFNSQFYEKVFELILRMRGNYLWPAMWGRMFYVEDPKNASLADEYGIVMGTSHHEPLTRAHAEWQRFGEGDWNYNTNAATLEEFWREGMLRRGDTETIVSIGMRGDGDEPMTEGTAIELLENIVEKQREIIEETTGKPASETPQLWALYKEVLDYYEKGMRVPDDVTLLLCDDNWGNIRKLPEPNAAPRAGGYGIYYHFDYVGGPRNYKWINTNQIERTWEQMHLAYEHGVDRIWIVNVGDIKPMEFPTQFFLDYAWDPKAWNASNLSEYYELWAEEIFGEHYAKDIAQMMKDYTRFNARRKPELIDANTYSLTSFSEADKVVQDYNKLTKKARGTYQQIPEELKDAFYQLVLFPIEASANLNELYVAAAKNKLYASQGRASANYYKEQVQTLFDKDASLTEQYHTELADGKWVSMMSQTHIGYTYWQQPDQNNIPETTSVDLPAQPQLGVAVAGSDSWWPQTEKGLSLLSFDNINRQQSYIEAFNRGEGMLEYSTEADKPWVKLSGYTGKASLEERISVSIDWNKVPAGSHSAHISVKSQGKEVKISLQATQMDGSKIKGFVEANGYISMEAENFSRKTESAPYQWTVVPNLGKTLSGIMVSPVNTGTIPSDQPTPELEYDVYFLASKTVKVHAYFSPTINYTDSDGLKYGIGFNDEAPQIINVHKDSSDANWNRSVADNIKVITSTHRVEKGDQVLKFQALSGGLVLQKIVIETGDLKQSYLGPPESGHSK